MAVWEGAAAASLIFIRGEEESPTTLLLSQAALSLPRLSSDEWGARTCWPEWPSSPLKRATNFRGGMDKQGRDGRGHHEM